MIHFCDKMLGRSNLAEEGLFHPQATVKGNQARTWGQELMPTNHSGTMLAGFISVADFISVAYSAGILTPPRATWPAVALLTTQTDKAHRLFC